jgi:hypothetical protein
MWFIINVISEIMPSCRKCGHKGISCDFGEAMLLADFLT